MLQLFMALDKSGAYQGQLKVIASNKQVGQLSVGLCVISQNRTCPSV